MKPRLSKTKPQTGSSVTMRDVDKHLRTIPKFATIVAAFVLCFISCKQTSMNQTIKDNPPAKSSTQPLPGGKARFSWVNGNFDSNGTTMQRIINLTFTAATGTVTANVWTWESSDKKGKIAFNSHLCEFEGKSSTCSTYAPSGWVFPSDQQLSWSGTYTYSGATLTINWDTPSFASSTTEKWTITNPNTALARASLISSNYGLTHGRGYGSNSSFSTYKTITEMAPFPNFTSKNSRRITANASSGTAPPLLTPTGGLGWATTALNLSTFVLPQSPTPANTMHYYQPTSAVCKATVSSCGGNTREGVIYHLSSLNNSRQMAYHFFCACHSSEANFPCYTLNNHPAALTQILDDNDNLVALIGIESQNPPESAYNGAYQYQLLDFNNIP